jgi:hypothetical protein
MQVNHALRQVVLTSSHDESVIKSSKMTLRRWQARNNRELAIEVWEALDCESVGARELEQIQQVLFEKFGAGGSMSPAAIARVVADEGAVLRHPEVFECDYKWRETNLQKASFVNELDFSDLATAFESVVKIEARRLQSDAEQLTELRKIVLAARDDTLLRSRSKIIDEGSREQLNEISQWLAVWLQSPSLFSDWLDLRRHSPEFLKKFGS